MNCKYKLPGTKLGMLCKPWFRLGNRDRCVPSLISLSKLLQCECVITINRGHILVASTLATRLVLAGVSGSTFFFINNHVNIAIMYIVCGSNK